MEDSDRSDFVFDQDTSIVFNPITQESNSLDQLDIHWSWMIDSQSTEQPNPKKQSLSKSSKPKDSLAKGTQDSSRYSSNSLNHTSQTISRKRSIKPRKSLKEHSLISTPNKTNSSESQKNIQMINSDSLTLPKKRKRSLSKSEKILPNNKNTKLTKRSKQTVLKLFRTLNGSLPKYEYLRVFILRRFKKEVRMILKEIENQQSTTVEKDKDEGKFRKFVENNIKKFVRISKTENGPITDGKSKRVKKTTHYSWNNKYCRLLFKDIIVKEGYLMFVKLVFKKKECRTLRKNFSLEPIYHRFNGCRIKKCDEAWDKLESYYSYDIFTNLKKRI